MPWIPERDPDAIHSNVDGEIAALTEKASPHDDDLLLLEDSEDSNSKKKVKLSNLGGGGSSNASYSEKVGDTSETTFNIAHSLDSSAVIVEVIEVSSGDGLVAGTDYTWSVVDDDNIQVVFDTAPGADDALVVVVASGGTSGGGGGGLADLMPWWDKGTVDDPPDDEFDDSSGMSGASNGLDDKWTAVSGSSGSVSLLTTSAVAIYDLTTRPGWLLIQTQDGSNVSLRQDYTLADGDSMVLALAVGLSAETGDNLAYAMRLNDNDSSSVGGNYVAIMVEQDSTEIVIQANSSADTTGTELVGLDQIGGRFLFFRIARSGLTYHCFASEGAAWHWVKSFTFGSAMTNLWISVTAQSATDVGPVAAIPWIRKGSNGYDPW